MDDGGNNGEEELVRQLDVENTEQQKIIADSLRSSLNLERPKG